MSKNHAPAILRWRDQVERIHGGLDAINQSATVSTMLFGCRSWLRDYAADAADEEIERIDAIRAELEGWLAKRGLKFMQ